MRNPLVVEFLEGQRSALIDEFEGTEPHETERREDIHYRLSMLNKFRLFLEQCIVQSKVFAENNKGNT